MMRKSTLCAALGCASLWAISPAAAQDLINPGHPEVECTTVFSNVSVPGAGESTVFPGYFAQWDAGRVCIPFFPISETRPADFSGDYYVEAFRDSKLRAAWHGCEADAGCAESTINSATNLARPRDRRTGNVDAFGAVGTETDIDLREVRRPAYFADYGEPIAAAEADTYTVEFTVPRDRRERTHLGLTDPIKLRGWYIRGSGVDGGAARGLIVIGGGGGSEMTAISYPRYKLDAASGAYLAHRSEASEEAGGMFAWRYLVDGFRRAGFDILMTDRRGAGISGGLTSYDGAEEANDYFRMLEQLGSGEGLRILTPEGDEKAGADAAGVPTGGLDPAEIPVVVLGYSRGSYSAQWFMHKNFVENCDLASDTPVCEPAVGLDNVAGAILLGANSGGIGYRRSVGHGVREGAFRESVNAVLLTDGEVLENIGKWPGLQIIRGTYDYNEALEGSLDAYRRATGLKDISVFAGEHGLNKHSPQILDYMSGRMVAFATAAVLGRDRVEGSHEPADLKDLVLSSPQLWEIGVSMDSWTPN